MLDPATLATSAASWLWESYGKKVLNALAGTAKARWGHVHWNERAAKYMQHLLDEHSTTKLLGNPQEIRIDKIYTDVWVLDQISAFRRLDVEDLKKGQFDRSSGFAGSIVRRELRQVCQETHRLYILGKPGAGKSTFLKTIVRLACQGEIELTPIFVPLRRWADTKKTLVDFIVSEFDICDFPDAKPFVLELLAAGGAIVLFDGLDEVPTTNERRKEVISALAEFSRRHSKCKIVLTCRTAATEYSFEKFTYVEIADFTVDQQRTFIGKWYSDRPESRSKLLSEWERRENSDLVDLARTPLLLALMCLAYDATLTFPRRRVELYEEAVNALLRKWDSSREISRDEIYRGLSHNRKEQMLRRVALPTFRAAEIFIPKQRMVSLIEEYLRELPPEDIRDGIDGDAVVRAMEAQHGLIVERAHGIFSFSHLTIHEYFVARKIVESTKTDEISTLMREHANDDQWREIVMMVASILDDGRFLLDTFVDILKQLATEERLASFVGSALSARREKTSRGRRYGVQGSTTDKEVTGDALIVSNACITIAGNMRALGVEERYLAIPRMISSALQGDTTFFDRHFRGESKGVTAAKSFFRLAALLTECLHLVAVPNRQEYLHRLLEPLRPTTG